MAKNMRLFLVRHGQSEANLDQYQNAIHPDHLINLSPEGHRQAEEAAVFLKGYFQNLMETEIEFFRELNERNKKSGLPHISVTPAQIRDGNVTRLWVSPFARTRQTAKPIEISLQSLFDTLTVRESIHLREQEYGLFDGIPDEQLPEVFPVEHAHYAKYEQNRGKFWARMPMGESRCDVAQRVHQWFGTIQRDLEPRDNYPQGIKNVVVVAHGVTCRAITMMWLHKPFEWFEDEPNPRNCSVRLIENGEDKGYIFEGFRTHHSKQETREAGVVD